MQNSWFECKVRYEMTAQDGSIKKVNEPNIVEALSFTEAEKRIIDEIAPRMTGEFQVTDIKRTRYQEIFETTSESADKWYRAKLTFITLDEKTAKEKKQTFNYLVQAADISDAIARVNEGMKGIMADYSITAVTETPIMDVFHYTAKPEFDKK